MEIVVFFIVAGILKIIWFDNWKKEFNSKKRINDSNPACPTKSNDWYKNRKDDK